MAQPTYTVEFSATSNLVLNFRVGYSTVGDTATIGDAFADQEYLDITSYVYSIRAARGRSDDLGNMTQGTCIVQLHDHDGLWNAENQTSDIYGELIPLRPFRVRATVSGTTYGIFSGFVDRIEFDPVKRITTIEAIDLFEWLEHSNKTFIATGATAGAGIGELLDQLEFTDPAKRNLDTGRSITQPGTTKSGTYLQQIGDVIAIDRGSFFISGSGIVRFMSGTSYWAKTSTVATLDGTNESDMRVSVDKQRIINRQRVTGASDQTALNLSSAQQFGYRDGSPITTAYALTDANALGLANWIIAIHGTPTVPARSIEVKAKDTATLAQMLSLEIGDRVAYSEPFGGTSGEGIIEGIRHSAEIGKLHTTRFLVSKRVKDAFTVGISTVGGVDVLYW